MWLCSYRLIFEKQNYGNQAIITKCLYKENRNVEIEN